MREITSKTFLFIFLFVLTFLIFPGFRVSGCTIASGISADGQVWTCNNEDGPVGVANFINVFPKSAQTKFGYFTLSYFSPKLGEGGNMQGGMNDAGLTFDFNAINQVKGFDPKSKKAFPQGDEQILPYILGNMRSVGEVIAFFEMYWFQNGFNSAQMHVADREGNFAIISASGIQLVKRGEFLVSTNFDICGKEDGSTCERYPVATSLLKKQSAGFNTMKAICQQTKQGDNTLYSNIQNLTTGDIWFFSKHDPQSTIKTNISDLLSRGRKSYSFSNLNSLLEDNPAINADVAKPVQVKLSDIIKETYTGIYNNDFTGPIIIEKHEGGIKVTTADGNSNVVQAQSENSFFFPGEDLRVEFHQDKKANRMKLSFYENGFWIFDAWRQESK